MSILTIFVLIISIVMTLQQLEYIVALDKYRQFVNAADACGVTQATLSILVKKLEEELDTTIFDRSSHPIKPTELGRKVIDQAKITLRNASMIKELAKNEKEITSGELRLSMVSTVMPIIAPSLICMISSEHPEVDLHIYEMRVEAILDKLHKGEIDMAVVPYDRFGSEFLEIPLFKEKFLAYISPSDDLYSKEILSIEDLVNKTTWAIHDGIRAYKIGTDIEINDFKFSTMYEGGRISLLLDIVDMKEGLTIIPALYTKLLSEERMKNVRPFNNGVPPRKISLIIRHDYVREKLLNIVLDAIVRQVPADMVDNEIRHLPIRI